MRNRRVSCRVLILLILFFIGVYLIFANPILAQEKEQCTQLQAIEENTKTICLKEGKELFWKQEYDEAIKQLKECIEQDPDNPEIYYYIAQAYFQQGQQGSLRAIKYFRQAYEFSDTAIEKYQQQIEANPEEDHTNDYLRLAYIYEIRSLIPGVDEYQQALDIYQELLDERPYINSAYYHMGWIYYQQEDYHNAIQAYLRYLDAGNKSTFAYYHLGLSYDKIGEKQTAEHYFRLILDEFPETDMANKARKELK
jgi:tetratricopeptide (TPR) repeat protein